MHARRTGKALKALVAAVAALGGLLDGCAPAWTVVKQATPNPLVDVKRFAVESVSYPRDGLRVGDNQEDAWLAMKKPDEVASYKQDRDETIVAFTAQLVTNKAGLSVASLAPGASAGEGFVVRPVFTALEPGIFTAVYNLPTTLQMTAQVLDKSGDVVDEVNFTATVPADIYHPATGKRMKDAGRDLGDQLVKYLGARTVGK